MSNIKSILSEVHHRPFELPIGKWKYYQKWNNALFLHWEIPIEILQNLVPKTLNIDTYDGKAYVSLVAFTMEKIRPRNLPSIQFISDFDEINIRTYIEKDGKKGVYFLNIEGGKSLSVFIAKKLSGLPYEKSEIKRSNQSYHSKNDLKNLNFESEYSIKSTISDKSELDIWLTERYCLYLKKENEVYRYDIHHKEWEIKAVEISHLNLDYNLGELVINYPPELAHFSHGVKVMAWKKVKV